MHGLILQMITNLIPPPPLVSMYNYLEYSVIYRERMVLRKILIRKLCTFMLDGFVRRNLLVNLKVRAE